MAKTNIDDIDIKDKTQPADTENKKRCPLSDAEIGKRFRIVSLNLDEEIYCRRLRELGVIESFELKIVQRTAFDGRVITINDARVGLDKTTAKSIIVEQTD